MSGHLKRFIVFLTMLVMSLSAFVCPANAEDSGLTVYFLDVGQADAAVIVCDDEVLMLTEAMLQTARLSILTSRTRWVLNT